MTRNPTTKTSIIIASALFAMAFAGNAYAESPTVSQSASVQSARAAEAVRSVDLRAYGDRFKLAIKAIEQDSKKPDWTWADGAETQAAKKD